MQPFPSHSALTADTGIACIAVCRLVVTGMPRRLRSTHTMHTKGRLLRDQKGVWHLWVSSLFVEPLHRERLQWNASMQLPPRLQVAGSTWLL